MSFPARRLCPRGEMDITLGFGPRVSGSNPDEGTKTKLIFKVYIMLYGRQAGDQGFWVRILTGAHGWVAQLVRA